MGKLRPSEHGPPSEISADLDSRILDQLRASERRKSWIDLAYFVAEEGWRDNIGLDALVHAYVDRDIARDAIQQNYRATVNAEYDRIDVERFTLAPVLGDAGLDDSVSSDSHSEKAQKAHRAFARQLLEFLENFDGRNRLSAFFQRWFLTDIAHAEHIRNLALSHQAIHAFTGSAQKILRDRITEAYGRLVRQDPRRYIAPRVESMRDDTKHAAVRDNIRLLLALTSDAIRLGLDWETFRSVLSACLDGRDPRAISAVTRRMRDKAHALIPGLVITRSAHSSAATMTILRNIVDAAGDHHDVVAMLRVFWADMFDDEGAVKVDKYL